MQVCTPYRSVRLGKRAASADTALRLSRYFGLSDRFWLNVQSHYDLEIEKGRLADRLDAEARRLAADDLAPGRRRE